MEERFGRRTVLPLLFCGMATETEELPKAVKALYSRREELNATIRDAQDDIRDAKKELASLGSKLKDALAKDAADRYGLSLDGSDDVPAAVANGPKAVVDGPAVSAADIQALFVKGAQLSKSDAAKALTESKGTQIKTNHRNFDDAWAMVREGLTQVKGTSGRGVKYEKQ
jgi:hypothetical protein